MDARIESVLKRMGELLQIFNGHPDPEQEEDGQKELLTSFQDLQQISKEDPEFETTNRDFLDDLQVLLKQIKEWDPLESWFKENHQLKTTYNAFLEKYAPSVLTIVPAKPKSAKKLPNQIADRDVFLDEVEDDLVIDVLDKEIEGKVNRRISTIEEKWKQIVPKDLPIEEVHLPQPAIHLENIAQDKPPFAEKSESGSGRTHITEIAIDMEQLKKIPVKKGQAPPILSVQPSVKQTRPEEKRPTDFDRILPHYINPIPLGLEHAPVPSSSTQSSSEIKQIQYRAILDSSNASADLSPLFQTEIKNRSAEDLFQALLYWESQDYYIQHEIRYIQSQLQQGTLNAAIFDHLKSEYERGLEKTQNAIKMIKASIK